MSSLADVAMNTDTETNTKGFGGKTHASQNAT